MVLDDLAAGADHRVLGAPLHLDDVVGHQAVAAHDQVEGDLALADAALAEQEDADAEDVEQHAVHGGAGGELLLEEALDPLDEGGGEVRGAEDRHAGLLAGGHHVGGDLDVLRDHQAGHLLGEEGAAAPRRAARRGSVAR